MRFRFGVSFLVFGALLTSCQSSSSPVDALGVGTSRETTSSIGVPNAPVPKVDVAYSAAAVPADNIVQSASNIAAQPLQADYNQHGTELALAAPAVHPIPQFAEPKAEKQSRSRMRIYSQRFRDAKPINFGKYAPSRYRVHGVDVSRWQGDIDWQRLRQQGANFAFIKATDGGDHVDPMFRANWRGAHAAGLKRGAYHFFYWCRTAGEQADWFIRNVPRDPSALPPVIDVEWNHQSNCRQNLSPSRVREKMQVFMDKLERHYGKRPIIYTSPDFYADNLRGAFRNHPFWLRAVAAHPSKVYPDRRWVFWQYSGSGLSHGVDGRIDLNTFYGSEEEWHRWLGQRS